MPFTVPTDVDCLAPMKWNIKFLAKCATVLDRFEWESRVTSALTRLIELLKEDFADGCSVTSIEVDREICSCKGPRNVVEFLEAEWYMNPGKAELDLLAYDYAVSTASIQAKVDAKQKDSSLADWTKSAAMKKALNLVAEIIILCDHEGSILGMNRAAEECLSLCLGEDGTVPIRGNSWIAHACHPDDAKEVLNTWKEAAQEGAQKSLHCRLMVEIRKYRSFLCRFTPSDSAIKGKLNWIIIATDAEAAALSVTKLKGRFLAEISHGNIEIYSCFRLKLA